MTWPAPSKRKPGNGELENAPRRSAVLERLLRRSARALMLERAARVGAALATLALFFLSLSWSGLWVALGVPGRMAGVALFGAAALFALAREIARGRPSRRAAAARLDAAAGADMRPAASLDDRLASDAADPATATLWEVHRRRLERMLSRTAVAPPRPRLAERDPFALRAFALVAAAACGFAAGDEKASRLAAAFDWRAAPLRWEGARVDAWLDPPAYTGRPPIVLPAAGDAVAPEIAAPVGSILRVRFSAGSTRVEGALAPVESASSSGKTRLSPSEREEAYKLGGPAGAWLPDGRAFVFSAIPDRAPTVAVSAPPRNNARGSMTLAFRAEDDYGVASVEGVISRPGAERALVAPPRLPLSPSPDRAGSGDQRATIDLSDSPWAGARAALTLVARDDAGNEGRSEPVEVTLPQRRFAKPLARALVEQRRNLALDPEGRAGVLAALEALSLAPEAFEMPSSIYLGLRAARRGLEGKRSADELRGAVDLLWAMALTLEEGDLSQAEKDLRAAERELREALARGADEEEVARRTQELRAALDKFLQSMGQQAARNRAEPSPDDEGSSRALSEQNLQSMLDEMAEAMKSGDFAQAQKLLDELQDMLENLEPAQGGGGRQKRMSRALSELDRLAREQQQLRDETYQGLTSEKGAQPSGQPRPGRGGHAAPDEDTEEAEGASGAAAGERGRQQGLRQRLERQQDALRGAGDEASEELDSARKAMKEAEEALGKSGGRGRAVEAQGKALQALRQGADKLASKMRGESGEEASGEGDGRGRGAGRRRGRGFGEDRDPLGREAGGGRGIDRNSRYDPLGLPPAARAHRLQEELRRRLGQPERPAEELDYLQRLLRR